MADPHPLAPGATLVLPVDAPREQWLAARRAGIGGSDASTLMGLNPYGSLLGLWLDKTGRGEDQPDTAAMARGRWLEPLIRDYVAQEKGLTIHEVGLLRSIEQPLAQCTPDGIGSDGSLIELKTAGWRKADDWADGQVADHAELQAQYGMFVTGLQHAWVAVSIDGNLPMIRHVERDEIIIGAILDEIEFFWSTYVVPDEPPPLSGAAVESAAVRTLYPVADPDKALALTPDLLQVIGDWSEAKAAEKEMKDLVARLDTRVRSLIGEAESVMPAGWSPDTDVEEKPLLTLKSSGVFAEKRFRDSEPELAEQFTVPATALDVDELRKQKPDIYHRYRARVLRTTAAFKTYREGA